MTNWHIQTNVHPGQSTVPSGVILIGRDGDPNATTRPAWALDGSFLAFRKLEQHVVEFDKFLHDNALPFADENTSLTPDKGAELLGARMVGRWKSGAPIDLTPLKDDPDLGADPERNNNFTFDHPGSDIKSDQSRCPFSAHIRKTRPRADLTVGVGAPAGTQENTKNQIFRSGTPYGPEVTEAERRMGKTQIDSGLAFGA